MARQGSVSAAFLGLVVTVGWLCLVTVAAAGKIYVVGDKLGWTVPTPGFNYSNWSTENTFYVGDALSFSYDPTFHSVLAFNSSEGFQSCSVSNSSVVAKTFDAGNPTLVNLTTVGTKWYACGFGTHCERGQKFSIKVEETPPSSAGFSYTSQPISIVVIVLGIISLLV